MERRPAAIGCGPLHRRLGGQTARCHNPVAKPTSHRMRTGRVRRHLLWSWREGLRWTMDDAGPQANRELRSSVDLRRATRITFLLFGSFGLGAQNVRRALCSLVHV